VVLAAKNIPYFLEHEKHEWRLLVPEEQIPDAIREVNLYEDENLNWPSLPPPRHSMDANSYATLSVLILLAAFHNVIRSDLMMVNGSYGKTLSDPI
jgi:rhomboid protease GluP